MVNVQFEGNDESFPCEGCGVEIPSFLDSCPYCNDDSAYEEDEAEASTEAPCPQCGVPIYDDSVRCVYCGAWVDMKVAQGKSGNHRRGTLVIVVLVVLSLLYWALRT